MLFKYKIVDKDGENKEGQIEAVNVDIAINSLQDRGFVVVAINSAEKKEFINISLFEKVSNKEIVILSRQISTLFEAQVSILRIFRLLSSESDNPLLRKKLSIIADDIQAGSSIAASLARHPKVFSDFYVSMVAAGEESGQLSKTFMYLADHLDRSYELMSKAKNALIYPLFVIGVFAIVMILMFTVVIPKISAILVESGQEIPFFTQMVLSVSNFLIDYGIFLLVALVIGGFFLYRFTKSNVGSLSFSRFKISIPYIGGLYQKLYLARIAGNINTMVVSGIPIVKTLESTASVVDNAVYKNILLESAQKIKDGKLISEALGDYPEIPSIMIQMMKIGEETGELGRILATLSKFYEREVDNAVNTLVSLIEPILIVALALGVGVLLSAVLIPIYNISGGM
ncbi:hypothetical protein A2442_02165 [Candidatus Campbellbacteria bacterium RIFOXYC2_FULL_35_25]|uniref:Type II secretion system protein GspF domain-containing protein n=1 Tax=Candidatus Campbellbacteria bacterium RIFOXYC2_FULL_35_25 TaxID=1797582 RepID=A0A1F5EIY8_9BACT|nr:MAG: hypothetical protein A2442_02165 [Candidatus Campbellbacteria bacterium RIFOXYC2_FULL_35_25]